MTLMGAKPSEPCLAFILAGGRGSRLHELTDRDCKPAIPFAGSTRIVDFVLANTLNSGIHQALVATQYQPHRLISHVRNRWEPRFGTVEGRLECVGSGADNELEGYKGTADAVYRNVQRIDALRPRHVLVLAADHVYQMDYRHMIEQHVGSGAEVTIAADIVSCREATGFGVIAADDRGRITGFQEKPARPIPMAGHPDKALASMGIYVFDWPRLRRILIADAANPNSTHDFGKDILPKLAERGHAYVHHLRHPLGNGRAYWRDVGTIDALHAAHMDLLHGRHGLDVENWPLHAGWIGRPGEVAGPGRECLVYPGSEAIGAHLDACSVGPLVSINAGARLQNTVIMNGAQVGGEVRIRDAVIAPGTRIDGAFEAGHDADEDEAWFRRSPGGILLIDQGMVERWQLARRLRHGWTRGIAKAAPQPPARRSHEMFTIPKQS